jgi:hypothetical protein
VCWHKIGDHGSQRLPTKVLLYSSSADIIYLPQEKEVSPEAKPRIMCDKVSQCGHTIRSSIIQCSSILKCGEIIALEVLTQ